MQALFVELRSSSTKPMHSHTPALNSPLTLTLVFFALALLCVSLAFYVPPFADDFCHAYDMQQQGSWLAYLQTNWANLNGRWATTSLRYAYDLLNGPDDAYWLTTPISIVCIFAGFYFLTTSVLADRASAVTASLLFSLLFIAFASKVSSLIYWSTGMTDYTVGYLLLGVVFYLSLRELHWGMQLLGLPLVFLASGLSELMLVPLGLLMLYRLATQTKSPYTYLLLIAFSSGAALNVFAPGNMARLARIDPQELDVAKNVFADTLLYGARGVLLPAIALYISSYLPFIRQPLLALSQRTQELPTWLARALTCFALLFPFFVIGVLQLSLGAPGPGRAHNVSLFAFIALWPLIIQQLPFLQPRVYRQRPLRLLMIGLATLALVAVNIKDIAQDLISGDAKSYSEAIDLARATLSLAQNQGQTVIIHAPPVKPNVTMGDGNLVSPDPNDWLNRCVALYHGNAAIQLAPK